VARLKHSTQPHQKHLKNNSSGGYSFEYGGSW